MPADLTSIRDRCVAACSAMLQAGLVGATAGSIAGLLSGGVQVYENGYLQGDLSFLAATIVAGRAAAWALTGGFLLAGWALAASLLWQLERLALPARHAEPAAAALQVVLAASYLAGGLHLNRAFLPGRYEPSSILTNVALTGVALSLWWLLPRVDRRLGLTAQLRPPGRKLLAACVLLLAMTAGVPRALCVGLAPTADATRPNVLLIVVDALRPDRLGAYGYARPTSPNLDQLAEQSWVFTQVTAPSSWTKPTVAALFTGLYPRQSGIGSDLWSRVDENGHYITDSLSPRLDTLAELLRAAGYRTAAFGENRHLVREFGFAQGFSLYEMMLERQGSPTRTEIPQRLFAWLRDSDTPFFAYLHFFDVHIPYLPPKPFRGRFAGPAPAYDILALIKRARDSARGERFTVPPEIIQHMSDLYDEEVAALDDALGDLFDQLRRDGQFDDTLIVVTADHGEEFLEHDDFGHGTSLHDVLIRVPLIVKPACGAKPCAPRRVEHPVDLLDVMPTVLAAAKVESRSGMVGRDLASASLAPDRVSFSELGETVSARTPRFKRIRSTSGEHRELFDLTVDPGETTDVSDSFPLAAEQLDAAIETWLRATAAGAPSSSHRLTKDEIRALRALGYIE